MKCGDVVAERFELERLAGWGGMGVVYQARDQHTDERVALKVIRGAREDDVRRFAVEVRALTELRHPRIVRYVAHGETPAGEPYLAMEWLEGEDLSERLARAPLSLAESVTLIARAAEALGVAHARGVLHRDVKPSNLYLRGRDVELVMLLDFGVARLSHQAPTSAGMTVGTPGYMAPEQARSGSPVDARADVFSLGCVLFECLAGRPAFVGDHMMIILSKVLLEEVPRLRELRDDVPPPLDDLVAAMLSKDPAGRPENGAEVAQALARLGDATALTRTSRPPPRLALTSSEQRIVSVVVAEPAEEPMPELAATLTPRSAHLDLDALRESLARYGARFEPLVDGSLVATLTGSAVATDQAAKAARCALAMRELLPGADIVLATGRAVLAEHLPVGEVIERAVTLLRRALDAPPRRVGVRSLWIDDVTAGLLDARFDVRSDEAGVHELVGLAERTDAGRTLLGRATPFVGREREIRSLVSLWDECVGESVARAALVVAPAGAGKSRLRRELLLRIASQGEVEVLDGRGDSMRRGAPFGVVAPALRRSAGVFEGEPAAAQRDKIAARVARHVEPAERQRVVEFLGELIDVRVGDDESAMLRAARRDARLMNDQVRRAWEDFLAAECRARPVILVLEDLHWGDLPSVQLVDAALRALEGLPFLVLAFARPEVKDLFPELFGAHGLLEMRLPPLTRKASESLVREVLGGEVDAGVVEQVVERSGGNAFFLEELIRAVASGRSELPETVLAMVEARLEELELPARRVLRAASVFGEVFWEGGVEALLGGDSQARDVADWLEVLVQREVVAARGRRTFPGEQELAFRHALVREAAYATLTDEDRKLGHKLAGRWLEAAGERQAVVVAEHFERGGERERAAVFYRRAAEQALQANDLAAALARAGQARAAGAHGEELGALSLLEAEAHRWRGEFQEARESGLAAMRLLPRGGARFCQAAAEVATAHNRAGDHEALSAIGDELSSLETREEARGALVEALARVAMHLITSGLYDTARALAERARELASAQGGIDAAVAPRLEALRALQASFDDDLAGYRRATEAAIEGYDAVGDVRSATIQRVNLGDALRKLGLYDVAEPVLTAALARARAMGLAYLGALAKSHLAGVRASTGALAEARALAAEAVETFRALGDRRWEGFVRTERAQILAAEGDLGAAEAEAYAAVECLAVAPPLGVGALATCAEIALLQNKPELALDVAREAVALLERLGKIEEGESLVRLVHARALAATGAWPEARAAIARAEKSLLARAAAIRDETMQSAFLTRVRENAETLELARKSARNS